MDNLIVFVSQLVHTAPVDGSNSIFATNALTLSYGDRDFIPEKFRENNQNLT